MSDYEINIPDKLIPVFDFDEHPYGSVRFRGSHGGRGSAKTRTFAKMVALKAVDFATSGRRGSILCGREFMATLADSSMAELKEAIREEPILEQYFDMGQDFIRTKCGRVTFLFAGLRYNLDSLKSKARVLLTWVDEAETVSKAAWDKLLPTVLRDDEGSEVWVTWNPERMESETNRRFRLQKPDDALIVELNYTDNPWFPDGLEKQRLDDLQNRPEDYDWIWLGAYRSVGSGAVFKRGVTVEEFDDAGWSDPLFGLDFGFSKDPTAGVKCYVRDRKLYISHECGGVEIDIDKTADIVISGLPDVEKYPIRADNARPESISYLRRNGLPRICACEKGKGSVEDGIEFIKGFDEIIVHPRCKNVQFEFRNYRFKIDKYNSEPTGVIEDANNHWIDALRYALEPVMKQNRLRIRVGR